MKKIVNFMRSMKFGMLLLVIIALLCLPGTLIKQGQTESYYAVTYGETWGGIICALKLDNVYSAWYFLTLFGFLCLNMLLCSVVRLGKAPKMYKALIDKARKKEDGIAYRKDWIESKHLKEVEPDLFVRNKAGLYGSFVTHLGILMLLIMAACTFTLQEQESIYVRLNESVPLEGQGKMTVTGFTVEDEKREADYRSAVVLTTPDGTTREEVISVNRPLSVGNYKLYQQSYAFMPRASIATTPGGQGEIMDIEQEMFLTLDGSNGVAVLMVFGDVEQDENGQMTPITMNDGSLPNPYYLIRTYENGETQEGLVQPGTTIAAGGVYVTFLAPEIYPCLTVKTLPPIVMPLMYMSFVILLIGLYLCFFRVPYACCVRDGKMAVASLKDEQALIQTIEEEMKLC